MACRSLGFETGAQIISGEGSALPLEDGTVNTMGQIICNGDEMSLSECRTSVSPVFDYGAPPGDFAVALVCSSASGALRIKSIAATRSPTPDAIHPCSRASVCPHGDEHSHR